MVFSSRISWGVVSIRHARGVDRRPGWYGRGGLDRSFVGAVTLSVGYKLLMSWVDHSVAEQEALEHSEGNPEPDRPVDLGPSTVWSVTKFVA